VLKRSVAVFIVVVGVAALGSLLVANLHLSRQELKSCFSDVQGLRPGAEVRIAGVGVGSVRSVRADPLDKNCPAEVDMVLATSYELHVPNDAVTSVDTAGILGPSYLAIDTSQASGTPIENYGYLKSKATKMLSTEEVLRAVEKRLTVMDESIKSQKNSNGNTESPAKPSKP
jgi:phospholipid/cholesterol/gamma-HCH transport system substrate-binding protein